MNLGVSEFPKHAILEVSVRASVDVMEAGNDAEFPHHSGVDCSVQQRDEALGDLGRREHAILHVHLRRHVKHLCRLAIRARATRIGPPALELLARRADPLCEPLAEITVEPFVIVSAGNAAQSRNELFETVHYCVIGPGRKHPRHGREIKPKLNDVLESGIASFLRRDRR